MAVMRPTLARPRSTSPAAPGKSSALVPRGATSVVRTWLSWRTGPPSPSRTGSPLRRRRPSVDPPHTPRGARRRRRRRSRGDGAPVQARPAAQRMKSRGHASRVQGWGSWRAPERPRDRLVAHDRVPPAAPAPASASASASVSASHAASSSSSAARTTSAAEAMASSWRGESRSTNSRRTART